MGKTITFELNSWWIESAKKGKCRLKLVWKSTEPVNSYRDDEGLKQEQYIDFDGVDSAVTYLKENL